MDMSELIAKIRSEQEALDKAIRALTKLAELRGIEGTKVRPFPVDKKKESKAASGSD
jgi:hypothetical protein